MIKKKISDAGWDEGTGVSMLAAFVDSLGLGQVAEEWIGKCADAEEAGLDCPPPPDRIGIVIEMSSGTPQGALADANVDIVTVERDPGEDAGRYLADLGGESVEMHGIDCDIDREAVGNAFSAISARGAVD